MLWALTACRTVDHAPTGAKAAKTKEPQEEVSQPSGGAARAASTELKGFDLTGASTCLPLETGRHCLVRKDLVADACAKAQGEVLKCEDCRLVCSKAVVK